MAAPGQPFLFCHLQVNPLFCPNVSVMTASDVHKKVQEISQKYISGKPPITLENLAAELDTSEDDLHFHLKQLATLGLISFAGDFVTITDSGIKASLP
ncbi:MAG: hypothetical protein K0R82_662 [Flavipsychrobacter sp.]|jgi:hypothetical protein|nr:hypothetical protein [Flavipsychrobacter sp.]